MSVIFTLPFLTCLATAFSYLCDTPRERLSRMILLSNNTLKAAKLNDLIFTSIVECSSHCTSEEMCLYLTVNRNTYTCTIYSIGTINYNVTELLTYEVIEKNVIKVLISSEKGTSHNDA